MIVLDIFQSKSNYVKLSNLISDGVSLRFSSKCKYSNIWVLKKLLMNRSYSAWHDGSVTATTTSSLYAGYFYHTCHITTMLFSVSFAARSGYFLKSNLKSGLFSTRNIHEGIFIHPEDRNVQPFSISFFHLSNKLSARLRYFLNFENLKRMNWLVFTRGRRPTMSAVENQSIASLQRKRDMRWDVTSSADVFPSCWVSSWWNIIAFKCNKSRLHSDFDRLISTNTWMNTEKCLVFCIGRCMSNA